MKYSDNNLSNTRPVRAAQPSAGSEAADQIFILQPETKNIFYRGGEIKVEKHAPTHKKHDTENLSPSENSLSGESLSCLTSHASLARPDLTTTLKLALSALTQHDVTEKCCSVHSRSNSQSKDRELFTQKECRCHLQRLENSPINSQKLVIFLPASVLPRNKHGKIFPEQGKVFRVVKHVVKI